MCYKPCAWTKRIRRTSEHWATIWFLLNWENLRQGKMSCFVENRHPLYFPSTNKFLIKMSIFLHDSLGVAFIIILALASSSIDAFICLSLGLPVCASVTPFYHVPIIGSSWEFRQTFITRNACSMYTLCHKVHRSRSQWLFQVFAVSDL